MSCRPVCQRKLLQQHSEAVILLRKVCGEDGLYVNTNIPEDIDESFILFRLRSDGLREVWNPLGVVDFCCTFPVEVVGVDIRRCTITLIVWGELNEDEEQMDAEGYLFSKPVVLVKPDAVKGVPLYCRVYLLEPVWHEHFDDILQLVQLLPHPPCSFLDNESYKCLLLVHNLQCSPDICQSRCVEQFNCTNPAYKSLGNLINSPPLLFPLL